MAQQHYVVQIGRSSNGGFEKLLRRCVPNLRVADGRVPVNVSHSQSAHSLDKRRGKPVTASGEAVHARPLSRYGINDVVALVYVLDESVGGGIYFLVFVRVRMYGDRMTAFKFPADDIFSQFGVLSYYKKGSFNVFLVQNVEDKRRYPVARTVVERKIYAFLNVLVVGERDVYGALRQKIEKVHKHGGKSNQKCGKGGKLFIHILILRIFPKKTYPTENFALYREIFTYVLQNAPFFLIIFSLSDKLKEIIMFATNKKIKQMYSQIEVETRPEYDENGIRVINLNVSDDDGFLSPYSYGGKPLISMEVAEFLNQSLKHLKIKEQVRFVVRGNTIDENEKKIYEQAIKYYYSQDVSETKSQLKHNAVLSAVMLLIGAIVFSVAITLTSLGVQTLVLDILDVVAWVFVWEAVDLFVLQRTQLKHRLLKSLKTAAAEITFVNT